MQMYIGIIYKVYTKWPFEYYTVNVNEICKKKTILYTIHVSLFSILGVYKFKVGGTKDRDRLCLCC